MDGAYVNKVLKGDAKAFEYLISKYKDMSYTISYRILQNEQDAEECVQDSFMKVYRNLSSFKKDSKFSTWLYKVVYNTSLTKLKSLKRNIEISEFTDAVEDVSSNIGDILTCLKNEDQKKYINAALEKVNKEDSLLLTLYYLNEMTIEEIEEISSWSKANIKIKLHRSRKNLQRELSNILKSETSNLL